MRASPFMCWLASPFLISPAVYRQALADAKAET